MILVAAGKLKMASVNDISEEMTPQIKTKMQELYSIWDKIGLENEKKLTRCKTAWQHLVNLIEEISIEEKDFYNCLLNRVDNYSKEILKLSQELSFPHSGKIEGTLFEQENILRKKLYDLSQVKQDRLKRFADFRRIENRFCSLLGWKPLDISSETGVPTEKNLEELEQYISVLKKEKVKRLQRLFTAKNELTIILEETELQPESSFEREILNSTENFPLTDETFRTLDQAVQKVKHRKADLDNERKAMVNKLNNLWEKLKIPENETKSFLSKHSDCKVSTLKFIKEEIFRCEEIKKQNLKSYIRCLRDELLNLWEECFVCEKEREDFFPFKSDEFTEDNLEAHEAEVEKWRGLHEKTESIRKKIKKRDELWNLLTVFEKKACDPQRFKNRRGNLLQEERERKKLQRDLPALEEEIFSDLEMYEKETGSPFLYYGQDYRIFISEQWEERNSQKGKEKQIKHKQRAEQVGMIPETPGGKRLLRSTPKSAPGKLFKSPVRVPVYRTPMYSFQKSPYSVGKLSTKNRLLAAKNPRNADPTPSGPTENTACPIILGETTYSDFSQEVNNSSRKMQRSTVLTSKKVVGTRTSRGNKNKNSSSNKSSRKSTKNKQIIVSELTEEEEEKSDLSS